MILERSMSQPWLSNTYLVAAGPNTDGLDDNLGYIAMFAIWGIGMTMDLPGDVVEDLRGRVVFLRR